MKYIILIIGAVMLFSSCSVGKQGELPITTSSAKVSDKTKRCLDCHTRRMPSVVSSWRNSAHAKAGVGCFECHSADEGDIDGFDHYGAKVAVIVSPKDCSACHKEESEQFLASHHAQGGQVLGSLDNYLGEVVEGFGASVSGCQQCHGSFVRVEEDGHLAADTWPNFGIGRVNPDGTSGTCSACHSRHDFSLAQARSPDTCGKCHMGPDHPQKEVYDESKHAIAYYSHIDEMNLDSKEWVVGVDYDAAPTCATCHVSATRNQPKTHDIGLRVSWNIRAIISFKNENWEQKRKSMQEVCLTCHAPDYVENHYKQLDGVIDLYNNKFAQPATDIMKTLRTAGKIDDIQFNEEIEWIYFYLWHHEGRRARNGAAMMGPDYVQWHGFYDIAERFYIEFVHAAEELLPGVTDEVLSRPEHKWFTDGLTAEEREQVNKLYSDAYKNEHEDEH